MSPLPLSVTRNVAKLAKCLKSFGNILVLNSLLNNSSKPILQFMLPGELSLLYMAKLKVYLVFGTFLMLLGNIFSVAQGQIL